MSDKLKIMAGAYTFEARFETKNAPNTVAAIREHLPYRGQLVHVRWSGEGVWVPLGDTNFNVGYENHTSHPAPGQVLLYPGGVSEAEILLAYGGVDFSSKMGQLAGNHFITIISNQEDLPKLGNDVLWKGAQNLLIEQA